MCEMSLSRQSEDPFWRRKKVTSCHATGVPHSLPRRDNVEQSGFHIPRESKYGCERCGISGMLDCWVVMPSDLKFQMRSTVLNIVKLCDVACNYSNRERKIRRQSQT